jgi:hypothetical protein
MMGYIMYFSRVIMVIILKSFYNASDKNCMSLVSSFRKRSEEFFGLPEIKL